jgi:hypothetical protein
LADWGVMHPIVANPPRLAPASIVLFAGLGAFLAALAIPVLWWLWRPFFTRPGRRGDYSPRLPQIRTCPIKASGSSSHGLAADGDTRWDG